MSFLRTPWLGRLYGPRTVKSMASVFFKILHLVRELHTFQLRIVSHDCRYLPAKAVCVDMSESVLLVLKRSRSSISNKILSMDW